MKIKEVIYNTNKKSLTIIFENGKKIGFIGKMARVKFDKLHEEKDVDNLL